MIRHRMEHTFRFATESWSGDVAIKLIISLEWIELSNVHLGCSFKWELMEKIRNEVKHHNWICLWHCKVSGSADIIKCTAQVHRTLQKILQKFLANQPTNMLISTQIIYFKCSLHNDVENVCFCEAIWITASIADRAQWPQTSANK